MAALGRRTDSPRSRTVRRPAVVRQGPNPKGPNPRGVLAPQPLTQQLLALLGALAALRLGLAEEPGEFGVAVAFRVLDIGLQAQGVTKARLGEPDDVVILVLGAGDLSGLAAAGHVRLLEICGCAISTPTGQLYSDQALSVPTPNNSPAASLRAAPCQSRFLACRLSQPTAHTTPLLSSSARTAQRWSYSHPANR